MRHGEQLPHGHRWARLTAAAAVGAAVAVIALELIPPVRAKVGPTGISARGETGLGGTSLLIPPLGAVAADTHPGPLSLSLSLTQIDVSELASELESDPTGTRLAAELESDLRGLVVKLVVQQLLGGAILGGVALALLPRRAWRYIVAGAAGGLAAMGVMVGITATTFSVDAFEEPEFTGALSRAPVVIDALQSNEFSFGDVQSRFETAATRLTELLALINEPNIDPREDSVAILHISDVHSNPIGLEIARQLARRFDVDAILDTGDLTNFGLGVETRITELVERFDVPYIFVPGNHDSVEVRRAMERLDNVTVLDGLSTEVGGVTILGFKDPTYTNWDELSPQQAADVRREFAATVGARVAESEPDVLAVHDRRIADSSFGLVPLILSGHYHKQIVEDDRGTRMLAVGSTGAAGLQSFTVDVDMNYEAEIVYFRGGEAVAFDYVRFTGLGSDFVIERSTLDDLGPLEPPEPSPTPSASTSISFQSPIAR